VERAKVNGVELEYEVVGRATRCCSSTARTSPTLQPLVAEPALERFQRIRYHRRGLGGSTRPAEAGPTSVAVQAEVALGLLDHVGVDRAHVVGHSLGGAIAMELAAQRPTRVASLVLLELALPMTPADASFGRAVAPLTAHHEAGDVEGAVHGFVALVGDRETEAPGVPEWTFGPEQAAAITCPALSVPGSHSSPLFVQSGNSTTPDSRPARTPTSPPSSDEVAGRGAGR
jgi:pimeloyl-ACP methyl ester carboxylesterase